MARRKKRKKTSIGLIVLLTIAVCLVLAIVGVCISWVKYSGALGEYKITFSNLFDLFSNFSPDVSSSFRTMASFAILSVVLCAATAVIAGIHSLFGRKLFAFILMAVSLVCLVCGVLTIVTTYGFCDDYTYLRSVYEYTPAEGMWLNGIGACLGGIVGLVAAVKR